MENDICTRRMKTDVNVNKLVTELHICQELLDEENQFLSENGKSFKEIINSLRSLLKGKKPSNEMF